MYSVSIQPVESFRLTPGTSHKFPSNILPVAKEILWKKKYSLSQFLQLFHKYVSNILKTLKKPRKKANVTESNQFAQN